MSNDNDKINLATGDKELLKAAETGENTIRLTPEVFKEMGKILKERNRDIDARYPDLVKNCDYETRLAVTAWVFENIVKHAEEGGTFRYLIYDRLGFEMDSYVPLYNAGGMTISNEFDLKKEKDA